MDPSPSVHHLRARETVHPNRMRPRQEQAEPWGREQSDSALPVMPSRAAQNRDQDVCGTPQEGPWALGPLLPEMGRPGDGVPMKTNCPRCGPRLVREGSDMECAAGCDLNKPEES